jgi:hypothetical protein
LLPKFIDLDTIVPDWLFVTATPVPFIVNDIVVPTSVTPLPIVKSVAPEANTNEDPLFAVNVPALNVTPLLIVIAWFIAVNPPPYPARNSIRPTFMVAVLAALTLDVLSKINTSVERSAPLPV